MKSDAWTLIIVPLLAVFVFYVSPDARASDSSEGNVVWLDTLDINIYTVMQEWGTAKANTLKTEVSLTRTEPNRAIRFR